MKQDYRLTFEGESVYYEGAKRMLATLYERGFLKATPGMKPVKNDGKPISEVKQEALVQDAAVRKMLGERYALEQFMNEGGRFRYVWDKTGKDVKVNCLTDADVKRAEFAALNAMIEAGATFDDEKI